MPEAHGFKCRAKVDIRNPSSVTLKNKRPATKVFRIGKA